MSFHIWKHIRRLLYGRVLLSLTLLFVIVTTTLGLYFISINIERDPILQDYSECKLCPKIESAYGNSSPSDLVLLGAFGEVDKSFPLIRSLRSVGSKARIVIVNNQSTDSYTLQQLEKCGVEYFQMKSLPNTTKMAYHSLRYIGYQQYINHAHLKYKRVLHTDGFDVFFQRDPFDEQIKPDNLYFVMEDINIGNSTWNSGWLERAYNKTISQSLENYTVSCSGTIIGGYDQFKKYLATMLGHRPFWLNGRHSLDQAYHNYLLHTGEFERNGVNIEKFGCNSPILTLHYCSRGKETIRGGQVVCPDLYTVPAIVHQYNLRPEIGKLLNKKCKAK